MGGASLYRPLIGSNPSLPGGGGGGREPIYGHFMGYVITGVLSLYKSFPFIWSVSWDAQLEFYGSKLTALNCLVICILVVVY